MKNNECTCRFCGSADLTLIIDFGHVALAGAFLKPPQFAEEKKYPLQICFCNQCFLFQIINRVSPEVLFRNYFYYSSAIATLRDHFKAYAADVTARFLDPVKSTVVEIGCNDGVLLNPLCETGIRTVIGVDPASNIVKAINNPKIHVINDFFNEVTAQRIIGEYGHADLIVANNVFAHIDDMHDVTRGIHRLLAGDGVFIFEVHYLGNIIEALQYDMIYHEHLYYYSLLALDNFFNQYDMEVFDVKSIPIHAGSMRYYVRKRGTLKREAVSRAVLDLRQDERSKGYHRVETYLDYAHKVEQTKVTLMRLLERLKKEGMTIWGYGASGRANTIIQYCDVSARHLECIIDDAPAKHGFYTPGSHFPIVSRDRLTDRPPDYILVFAWSFMQEILGKTHDYFNRGGRFIVPLPRVKTLFLEDGRMTESGPEE